MNHLTDSSPDSSQDELVFTEEPAKSDAPGLLAPPKDHLIWQILIIDDDPDVHSATLFALNNLTILQRSLKFLHAYSASEAKELLKKETAIAVILLDVVMEQEDAGLQLVNSIRNEFGLSEVRIILRTGQPGYAPEIDAIRDFDINDYKTKSELTRTKLFTTITAAVRSYEQICSINRQKRASDIASRTSKELISQPNLNAFSQIALRGIKDYFDQPDISIALFTQDKQNNALQIIGSYGQFNKEEPESDSAATSALIDPAIQSSLLQENSYFDSTRAVLFLNKTTQSNYALYVDTNSGTDAASYMLTPEDVHFLELFCNNVSVCLDNALLNIRLRNHAFTDPLTHLPNRLKLLYELEQILAEKVRPETTLALIDIDHFSETNNALGHHFGDLLLSAVAKRLTHHFGKKCKVARINSDTFSLLGSHNTVRPEIILPLFHRPFLVEKQEVQLSATIGLIKLEDYRENAADALKDTNIALKIAKKQQHAGYIYFTNKMGVEIRERVRLMRALHSAYQKQHLFLAYQPQVNIEDGAVIGAEALLRWKTAEGKVISPEQFIPIAEYSGLIIEMGNWVLRMACKELMELIQAGHTDFKMSVNVSQAQFSHPEFLNSVRKIIHESGVPPHLLDMEITESMAIDDPIFLMETLFQLKKIGIKISIDDFGTGFSSLSYLHKLPIDQLKIDRSFINQIVDTSSDASIPKMIIQLCQSLKISVIAEGVEKLEQAEALMSLGCPLAQGFYYARPMNTAQLHEWLSSRAK